MPIAAPVESTQPYSRRWAQHYHPGFRVLLALNGHDLNREILDKAFNCCRNLTDRLDVLVVRPPLAPTFLLGGLLIRLEQSGIDYRLASSEGELGEEVLHYLHRFNGIRTIVLERHEALPERARYVLRGEGYQLISLDRTAELKKAACSGLGLAGTTDIWN